ncbi:MAG: YdaS family helix-turn-helix protein [Acidiphilium sp.]|nr:YdaS family helix-turn-helix protein [Acidiphilium sp.]
MNIVDIAAAQVGGRTKLAALLGLHRASVFVWKRVPAERVLDVERATGISRHDLRADLYPRDEPATAA